MNIWHIVSKGRYLFRYKRQMCDIIWYSVLVGCVSFLNWEAGDRIQNSQLKALVRREGERRRRHYRWVETGVDGLWIPSFPSLQLSRQVTLRIKGWVSVRTVRSSTWPKSSPGTTSICTRNYIRDRRKNISMLATSYHACPSKQSWQDFIFLG